MAKDRTDEGRPSFLDQISRFYNVRRRNVVLLTGNIEGPFWKPGTGGGEGDLVSVEQLLVSELSPKFNVVRVDMGEGVTFYDNSTQGEVTRVCESVDGLRIPEGRIRKFKEFLANTVHAPLAALRAVQAIIEAFERVKKDEPAIKPVCVVMQHTGSMLPAGDYGRISELDRQRLVLFLDTVSMPAMANGNHLIVLVSETRTEVSDKILRRPNAAHVEIHLPAKEERAQVVNMFCRKYDIKFKGEDENGREQFIELTAGLSIANILDILEEARNTREEVTKEQVLKEVNDVIQLRLGDIVKVKRPQHTPADVVGFKDVGEILESVFQRCEDPETAVSAMIISGPNGSGKTYQAEAYAGQCGRIVLEIGNIRGMYFGETDRFFELLRLHVETLGKVLIEVDEAHAAFSSVHRQDVHETEKRLGSNFIKMIGDPRLLGKVLWVLMTSRPDELDPDVKSRSPIQIPIFDLEGEERKAFVAGMFARKNIAVTEEELARILDKTGHYSARDFSFFISEVIARQRKDKEVKAIDVLSSWQASSAIKCQREFQSLIATQNCSYPNLIPQKFRDMGDEKILQRIEVLKLLLRY